MPLKNNNSALSGQQQWNDLHLFKDPPLKQFVEFNSLKKSRFEYTVDNIR